MFRPDGVPEKAEALDVLPWLKDGRQPSKLLPGLFQLVPQLICPECKTAAPTAVSETIRCAKCDLSLHLASYLFVWRAAPAAKPRPKLEVVG